MQLSRTTGRYTPNFQAVKHYKLPTREVLECVTGKISQETLNDPSGLFTIFSKLFSLKKRDLNDFAQIPLGLNVYAMSSGLIIKANNPEIAKIAQKIKELPASKNTDEITRITRKLGSIVNIGVDDNIREYRIVNGELHTTKRW